MTHPIEPTLDGEGRIICPARVDQDIARIEMALGKFRKELAASQSEIRELKGIVTNGLQGDVKEIKEMVQEIKGGLRLLMRMSGFALTVAGTILAIVQILERV